MIIGIAGKIASGKSTLARALAVRLSAKRLGFGDYVRAIAVSRGLDSGDRQTLQDLGQELVTKDPAAFVDGILTWADHKPGQSIIFDGVRHKAVWDQIAAFARRNGEEAILAYLDMPESQRQLRLTGRGLNNEIASAFDNHPSELDLDVLLQSVADLRLDAGQNSSTLVEAVLRVCGK
jgi:dephospho-CoA kinase